MTAPDVRPSGGLDPYRALFEHARAAILLADDDARVVDANPAACRMLGYTRNELLGLSIWDVSTAGPLDQAHARWRQFLASGQLSGEYLLRRKDGTTVPVEFSSVANVRPGLHLVINRDVSERQRSQEQLRVSQSMLQTIVDSAPLVVFAVDNQGIFTLSIGKALAGLGFAPNELVGRSVFEVYRDIPEVTAQMRRALAGESFSAPVEAGGRFFQCWYIPQFDASDSVSGVLGVATDLTEQHQLEDQLRQAQKLESVGMLAGGIAHDFNNMITAISGYADLLLEELPEGHPLRPDAAAISAVAERAALLTYQLLAFGRKQILRPTTLDLGDLVTDLTRMLSRVIGEDIQVVIRRDRALGAVSADPGQISQVLLNLVVNARDAMPQGGTLTIETANVTLDDAYTALHPSITAGPYVILAVSDTGTGMTPEVQARIFEPFFTTKPAGRGTGMGLASVYGIVKQSGGHVWVYSEAGHGTTFKIYLPMIGPAEAPEPTAAEIRETGQGHETVLLVEDEEVVRELVKRALETAGYTVLDAPDGPAALELCARAEVQIVVTDVVMPKMSGRDLVDRLRADRPSLPVLFMSGYTDDAIVHHGVLDAGVEFIQKPFAMRALTRKVREILDRRKS
jgi:two-component system cell cycle sensor histidine kinase/response regulator CckA